MGEVDILHVFLHSLLDTAKIFPFLLVVFCLIALIEEQVTAKKYARLLGGRFAPVVGAVTGVIPQCGFSVMSVKLYKQRLISVGTLLAVFISTSDEAVALLITKGRWAELGALVLIKAVIAISAGYLADMIFKKPAFMWEEGDCDHDCCHHNHGEGKLYRYLLHPLYHCAVTLAYVLAVNFVFGLIVEVIGKENVSSFMNGAYFLQPVMASLIGLIPNCASSVVIVNVYLAGNLSFGALVAGLTANAGVGLALLFKGGKDLKRSIGIVLFLFLVAVIAGEIVSLIGHLA